MHRVNGAASPTSPAPRVVVVKPTFHPLYGGHILHLQKLAPLLAERGDQVTIVTAALPGCPARDTVAGLPVRRLPALRGRSAVHTGSFGLSAAWYLLRHRDEFDVVHVLGAAWHLPVAVLAAKLLRKKVFVEMVLLGSDDPVTLSRRPLGRLWLAVWKRIDRAVSLSSALSDACRAVGLPEARIVQIPIAVDTRCFRPADGPEEKRRLRERLGLAPDAKVVVFLGGIKKRKGIDLLVEAWPAVNAAEPAAHLLLVGPRDRESDGPFLDEIDARLDALSLRAHVTFAGRVDDVLPHLRASDVYVLASLHEGLPNSVIEGMACGLPPVLSEIPGISDDLITSHEEGIVVRERHPAALADALIQVLTDDAQREAMGRAARRRAVERFDIRTRADALDGLFRELLREGS